LQLEGSVPLFEKFIVSLEVSQLKTHIVNFLAMTGDEIKPLYVAQMIEHPTCVMKSLHSADFLDLGVSISIDTFQMDPVNIAEGTLEAQINDFVNVFASTMLDDFNPWVTDFIGGALQGPVKELVNEQLATAILGVDDTCEAHETWVNDEYEFLEFDKVAEIMLPAPEGQEEEGGGLGDLIGEDMLDRIMKGFLSPAGLNKFVDCMAQAVLGEGETVLDIAPMDGFRIQVKDVFVSGLDSFYALNATVPDPYSMKLGVGLGDSAIGE